MICNCIQLSRCTHYMDSNKAYTKLLMFVFNKNILQLDKFLMDKNLNIFHCIILFSCGIECMLHKLHKRDSWDCNFYSVELINQHMFQLDMWLNICLCT